MKKFVEQEILEAVRKMLTGRGNEILSDLEWQIPLFEFSDYDGKFSVVPVIRLFECERTEKERLIKLDTYTVSISFTVPEIPESEMICFAYVHAVNKAVSENPTFNGIVTRAVISSKKYQPPKMLNTGDSWQVVINLKISNEVTV